MSDYFAKPALSKSQLKHWRADNPLQFWHNSPLNPEYKPEGMTDTMAFGQLAHLLILEPARLKDEFVVMDGLGKSRINKKWQEAQEGEQKTIINQEELNRAQAMAKAISQYDMYRELLFGIKAEKEYCWHDSEWGIDCKARLDAIKNTSEGLYIIDYKTTGMIDTIERYIDKGGYQYDVGFYSRAVESIYGKKPVKFFLILQSNVEGEEHLIKVKCVEKQQLIACEIATDCAARAVVARYNRWKAGDPTAWLPIPEITAWEVSPWLDKEISDNMDKMGGVL